MESYTGRLESALKGRHAGIKLHNSPTLDINVSGVFIDLLFLLECYIFIEA